MSLPMIKLTYGDGFIMTQQGEIEGEGKCLTLTRMAEPQPVGSTGKEIGGVSNQESHDVVLVFKTLESARTVQDELNELISVWSRELSEKVDIADVRMAYRGDCG